MIDRKELIFRMWALAAIALAATVVALALENYFGRTEIFAAWVRDLRSCGCHVRFVAPEANQWSPLNGRTVRGDISDAPTTLLAPVCRHGAADDDPSGIATYSQASAQFGFSLT